MRKGFTIIELLIVITIIGILMGITTIAIGGAMRNSREKRRDMMQAALKQAIATYYAQEGQWPDVIEAKADGMTKTKHTFSPSDTDKIFQQVVGKGFGKSGAKSMLVDASALFVCDSSKVGNSGLGCTDNHGRNGCAGKGCHGGVNFSDAVAKGSKNHLSIDRMAFGYPGREHNLFCRFTITYNCKTDSVSVGTAVSSMGKDE